MGGAIEVREGHRGLWGVVGGAGWLCYAPNNVKKSQFYVILWESYGGLIWGSVVARWGGGRGGGVRDMNNA